MLSANESRWTLVPIIGCQLISTGGFPDVWTVSRYFGRLAEVRAGLEYLSLKLVMQ